MAAGTLTRKKKGRVEVQSCGKPLQSILRFFVSPSHARISYVNPYVFNVLVLEVHHVWIQGFICFVLWLCIFGANLLYPEYGTSSHKEGNPCEAILDMCLGSMSIPTSI